MQIIVSGIHYADLSFAVNICKMFIVPTYKEIDAIGYGTSDMKGIE